MVDLNSIKNIYLYPGQIDYRLGPASLVNLILAVYKESEIMDCLFIFFGKRKNQIKMIEINKNVTWFYNKRLNNARFLFPDVEGRLIIDRRQLITILEAIKSKE